MASSIAEREPIGVSYIHGGVTTLWKHNPSFQVVDFDAEYMVPVNMHNYYFDLVEATENYKYADSATKVWKKQFDLKSEYGLADMSPSSVKDLLSRFGSDAGLYNRYNWNRNSRGSDMPTKKTGDVGYVCSAFIDPVERHKCINERHRGRLKAT